MAGQIAGPALRPSKERGEADWESIRPEFIHLYVEKGIVLREVVEIFKRQGFHASERMFKQRISKWNLDRKTTRDVEYLAMSKLYEQYRLRGEEIEFSAASGRDRKFYTISDIKKQIQRVVPERLEKAESDIREKGILKVFERRDIQVEKPGIRSFHRRQSSPLEYESPVSEPVAGSPSYAPGLPNYRLPTTHPANAKRTNFNTAAIFAQMDSAPESARMTTEIEVLDGTGLAQRWVWHVLQTDILTYRKLEGAGWHRVRGRNDFSSMLQTGNLHILTGLFHISAVLSCLGHDEIYLNFLKDCCEIIDTQCGTAVSYMTPYRYALACEIDDSSTIERYSEELKRSTILCRDAFGEASPNTLASLHFQASYLLDQKRDIQGAIAILERCLDLSNNVLESNHLINVNCIALLARAQAYQGKKQISIDWYADAAERCKLHLGQRHPYRLRFLREMGMLQRELGYIVEAEQNLREVFYGRRETLGPGHEHTWGSLEDLRDLLTSQNRGHEWKGMELELQRAHWANNNFVHPREAYMPSSEDQGSDFRNT